MSRSSITLSIATWMRSARSGSSLMATIPRWQRGISPKWMVSGSPRVRPSATFIGSTSPIRSATEVSGRGQLLGVPLVAVPPGHRQVVAELLRPPPGLGRDRFERVLAELGAVDDGGPLVDQADQGAQQRGSCPGRAHRAGRRRGRRSGRARAGVRRSRRSRAGRARDPHRRPAWPAGWGGSPLAATGARARSRAALGRWRWSGIPNRSRIHATHAHNVERARSRGSPLRAVDGVATGRPLRAAVVARR